MGVRAGSHGLVSGRREAQGPVRCRLQPPEGLFRATCSRSAQHHMLYVFDPVAMHSVVVKDQHVFAEPRWLLKRVHLSFRQKVDDLRALQFQRDPVWTRSTGELWCVPRARAGTVGRTDPRPGDKHRKQRKMLNPVFSIAHMRQMIPIFHAVVHRVCRSMTLSEMAADADRRRTV